MSYSTDEMRTLINFHRKYSEKVKVNYYLRYLELLEEQCPDIQEEVEEQMYQRDNEHNALDTEEEARAFAIGIIGDWIAALEKVRDQLKGD